MSKQSDVRKLSFLVVLPITKRRGIVCFGILLIFVGYMIVLLFPEIIIEFRFRCAVRIIDVFYNNSVLQ